MRGSTRQIDVRVDTEKMAHLFFFVDFFFKVFIIGARLKQSEGQNPFCLTLKGGSVMKKFLFLLIVLVFLAGCSAEWYEHDTIYKNHDHMFYSMGGYKNTTKEDLEKSESQGWWGEEVPYIPAE